MQERSKYDASGNEQWTRQFGSTSQDNAAGLAADASGIYLVGTVSGALPGQVMQGNNTNGFIRKYDTNGADVWTRQFTSAGQVFAYGVATHASDVYVVGETIGPLPGQTQTSLSDFDAYVRKYDANGTEQWTIQFGTGQFQDDTAAGVAAHTSGVFVVGRTNGILPEQTSAGGRDAFALKLTDLNRPPIANAGPDQTGIVNVPLTFNGTGSSDPDGSIVSYQWNFGDYTTASGVTVSHAYSTAGTYTATLTVTDNGGATASDTAQVTIQTPAQATQALISTVQGLGLPQGLQQSLLAKLQAALAAINRNDKLSKLAALNQLQAFIYEVSALQGVKLTPQQAVNLATAAQQIMQSLSSSP